MKNQVCRNCGQDIVMIDNAGPWIHLTTLSVDCYDAEATPGGGKKEKTDGK